MFILAIIASFLLPIALFAYGMSLSGGDRLYSDRIKRLGSPVLSDKQILRIMNTYEEENPNTKILKKPKKKTRKVTK